jgi:hypothetical protein
MSPINARLNPAPAATPLTAIIKAACILDNVEIALCRSSASDLTASPTSSPCDIISLISPPAQKNRPLALITTAFSSGSPEHNCAACFNSLAIRLSSPLAASGRFNASLAMAPCFSNMMCSKLLISDLNGFG